MKGELTVTPELIESLRRSQAQLEAGNFCTVEELFEAVDEGIAEGLAERENHTNVKKKGKIKSEA